MGVREPDRHIVLGGGRTDHMGKGTTDLCSLLNENFLKWCFWQLKRGAAPGIDQVDFYEYLENLDENIRDLVNRLKQKKYRAKLVRRQYIPKTNGELRPLGNSCYR